VNLEPTNTDAVPVVLNTFALSRQLRVNWSAANRLFKTGAMRPDFVDLRGAPLLLASRISEARTVLENLKQPEPLA
jgi:hypothetical protein